MHREYLRDVGTKVKRSVGTQVSDVYYTRFWGKSVRVIRGKAVESKLL